MGQQGAASNTAFVVCVVQSRLFLTLTGIQQSVHSHQFVIHCVVAVASLWVVVLSTLVYTHVFVCSHLCY